MKSFTDFYTETEIYTDKIIMSYLHVKFMKRSEILIVLLPCNAVDCFAMCFSCILTNSSTVKDVVSGFTV